MEKLMKKRLGFIDVARGIAIISIILGHLGSSQINRVVFTYHVPIFFFITGYFINTKKNVKVFIENKARTLLVPYAVTCMIIIILNTIDGYYTQGGEKALYTAKYWIYASVYGAGDSYQEPFRIIAIGAIWFLWATFWGSTFLRISLKMSEIMRVCMITLLFAFGYWSRSLFWFPFSIQAGCCATLFMYFGYLFKQEEDKIKELSMEMKWESAILAVVVWLEFIKNFQSFWLVHCDIGRGAIDIIGCICGCYIVFIVSWYLEKYVVILAKPLKYIGRFSILALCIHIIELDAFPWDTLTDFILAKGIAASSIFYIVILIKMVMVLGGCVLLSKSKLICRLYGIEGISTLNITSVKS